MESDFGREKEMKILAGVAVLVLLVAVWFGIPYSPFKRQFLRDAAARAQAAQLRTNGGLYAKEDFERLPPLLQKYMEACGYIGRERKSVLAMEYRDIAFSLGRNRPNLQIDYTQMDFADTPSRLAFIDARMFGVPFQGYDYYTGGKGGMKGVLAKLLTLFDQTGSEMDKACLVTYLAESIFLPEALLQDCVSFTQIDGYTVEARIENEGVRAAGRFHFNDGGEMVCFSTDERGQASSDGTVEYIPWEARCEGYAVYSDGIKRPTIFRAVWKYPDADFVYFDGTITSVDGAEAGTAGQPAAAD